FCRYAPNRLRALSVFIPQRTQDGWLAAQLGLASWIRQITATAFARWFPLPVSSAPNGPAPGRLRSIAANETPLCSTRARRRRAGRVRASPALSSAEPSGFSANRDTAAELCRNRRSQPDNYRRGSRSPQDRTARFRPDR